MILLAFVLPWINLRLFDLINIFSSSAFNLPNILEKIFNGIPRRALITIYGIPVFAFLSLAGELTRQSIAKVIGQVVTVIISFYWLIVLNSLIKYSGYSLGLNISVFDLFSYGFYLNYLCVIYYMIDLVREITGSK